MFAVTPRPKLLVKLASRERPKSATGELAIGKARLGVSLTPLMAAEGTPGLAARPAGNWWLASFDMRSMGAAPPPVNAWDLAHDLVVDGAALGGAKVEFAEPDLEQRWPVDGKGVSGFGFGDEGDPNRPEDPQDGNYNRRPSDDWFRDGDHSGLDLARRRVGEPADGRRVGIAHFDTGYDPDHATLPRHLDLALQRNFVDDGMPNDARDRTDGPFTNLGHGTGTLGILAGKAWGRRGTAAKDLGGAPFARIVPVRVANSVVLFRTSTIAKAFDYVVGLARDPRKRVDIVTMSMGGLASQAWAEAVNRAYEAGIFIVTAAGNNYGNAPTRFLVYPARFNRVVAACGVQARVSPGHLTPYADLPIRLMAGNYGPDSKAGDAMAAFTPNVPWARIHSRDKVDCDGGGTSSATPQIAAAAANWIQLNRDAHAAYRSGWMRVEAVRHALFGSALVLQAAHDRKYFGRGVLQASAALDIAPPAEDALTKEPADDARFALIRGLGGLGIEGKPTVDDQMLALEIVQASQSSAAVAEALGDPDSGEDAGKRLVRVKEALAAEQGLSMRLRKWLDAGAATRAKAAAQAAPGADYFARQRIERAKNPPVDPPGMRRLRVYASDPAAAASTDTRPLAHTTIALPWRDVGPGPVDDYFEVVDIDPATGACYAPVDLNHAHLLATDGLTPSESDPRFHQQMVYAVASKTVRHFELALGRPALWSPRRVRIGGEFRDQYVGRLRIHPHALREENAYYSPAKKALLFGYFREAEDGSHGLAPGSSVFTCLSYDIVAHETSHALLDGLHRRYAEISNADARAFHEAFSDLVALFQHFTHDDALRDSIARAGPSRGEFDEKLTDLARQFGRATGHRGALRSALGLKEDEKTGQKVRITLQNTSSQAHARGAVLVAAMFDAFLDIYRRRSADLVRIATEGTGILPDGQMHPDLVNRLAREAGKTADHMLRMLIRALDYCPPTSITFGDYLRALITSDFDLVPDDPLDYRTAIVSAFRGRGIHPESVRSISADSLRWDPPEIEPDFSACLQKLFAGLANDTGLRDWKLETSRPAAYRIARRAGTALAVSLRAGLDTWAEELTWPSSEQERQGAKTEQARLLGIVLDERTSEDVLGAKRRIHPFEVHSVRPARRVLATGQERLDLVVEVTQRCEVPGEGGAYRGGATWIVDAESATIRYIVHKRISNAWRIEQEHAFRQSLRSGLRWNYLGGNARPAEPFALVHRGNAEIAP